MEIERKWLAFYLMMISASSSSVRRWGILSALDNKEVILWDVLSGDMRFRFTGPSGTSNTVAFNPDGTRFAAGFGTLRFVAGGEFLDNSIRLWNTETSEVLARFEGHQDAVVFLAFSVGGRYVVSGSQDGKVIVWDLESGDLLRQISGHQGVVHFVAFTQNGEDIWSASEDGRVKLWNPALSYDDLIAWTKNNRYVPELTCDQLLSYVLETTCGVETE